MGIGGVGGVGDVGEIRKTYFVHASQLKENII